MKMLRIPGKVKFKSDRGTKICYASRRLHIKFCEAAKIRFKMKFTLNVKPSVLATLLENSSIDPAAECSSCLGI